MTPEDRLKELGIELPAPPAPGGVYQPVVVSGNHAYVSGQVPYRSDGSLITGLVGVDFDLEGAREVARHVGLIMLATLKAHLGSLNRIHRLVKTLGMVNGHPDFRDHPKVINAYSELMGEVFGPDLGLGARSAVGMMLPRNVAVEIEAIFELKE